MLRTLFTNTLEATEYVRKVKSTLVTSPPIERIFEDLLELLPRRMVTVKLLPSDEISIIDAYRGAFCALGNKPHFEFSFDGQLTAGWYYLEGSVVRHNGSRKGSIEVELFNESSTLIETIPVPTNLRGSIQEVFYLHQGVNRVFWIPTEKAGFLEQGPLLLHKISSAESFFRRFYRVLTDYLRQNKALPDGGLRLTEALFDLQSAYLKSAELRIKRYTRSYPDLFNDYLSRLARNTVHFEPKKITCNPKPSFSIIIKNPNINCVSLQKTILSVTSQIYKQWQLILIDNDHKEIARHQGLANQFKEFLFANQILIFNPVQNQSTIDKFNSALRAATGDFILWMDHGDTLLPHALLEVARVIEHHPEVNFIYTDNDSLDSLGNPCSPQFKPGWNPDLLRSYDYINRPAFYRIDKLVDIGGYRIGTEGAEDWDLSLRYLNGDCPVSLIHIPLLLYRTARSDDFLEGNSNLGLPQCTRLVHSIGKKILQDHVTLENGVVEDGPSNGVFRVKYSMPDNAPYVSIIIPTKDRKDLIEKCLISLFDVTQYQNFEVIIVDNQTSEKDALEYLKSIATNPQIRILSYPHPFNWSAINNYAIAYAKGSVLVLLNNDVEIISPEWLRELVSQATRRNLGVIGAKLLYSDQSIQHAGVVLGIGGVAAHVHRFLNDCDLGYCYRANVVQNYSAVTGACMAFRREIYESTCGFDERFAVAFNDIDFCLRVKKLGYRNLYTPYARFIHHESLSRGINDTAEKKSIFDAEFELMQKLWKCELDADVFYNQNLSKEFEDYSLSNCIAITASGREEFF